MSDDAEDAPSHAAMLSVRMTKALRENPEQKRASNHRGSKRLQRSLTSEVIQRDRAGKPEKRSKKSRGHWLRDLGRDEKIFLFINGSLRSKCPVAVSEKSADTVVKARHAMGAVLGGSASVGTYPTVGLPHWDHASERLQMIGWALATYEKQGRTFNLKLSDVVVGAALRRPHRFARYLQDRIRKALVREFRTIGQPVPEFWFAVEGGVVDQIHLHGAVEGVTDAAAVKAVEKALTSAGGTGVSNQLRMRKMIRPTTWAGYVTKWYNVARFNLLVSYHHLLPPEEQLIENVPVFAATNGCRKEARRAYMDARKSGRILFP